MDAGRPDRSFPGVYRLASSKEFRRVYQDACRGRSGPFAWHARVNNSGHPRLGLAIPKRVVKKATDRSRVKRVVRESFRHNRSTLPPVDIIVSVKGMPPELHGPKLHRLAAGIWTGVFSMVKDPPKSN